MPRVSLKTAYQVKWKNRGKGNFRYNMVYYYGQSSHHAIKIPSSILDHLIMKILNGNRVLYEATPVYHSVNDENIFNNL